MPRHPGKLNREIRPRGRRAFVFCFALASMSEPLDLKSIAASLPETDGTSDQAPLQPCVPPQLRRKMSAPQGSPVVSRPDLEVVKLQGDQREHAINALRRRALVQAESVGLADTMLVDVPEHEVTNSGESN